MSQSTELLIGINVKDGASAEFRKIGQGAQQMGGEIKKAGDSSASTLSKLQNAAKSAGLGIGLLGTSFTMFANKTRDAERDLRTLDRTYGDTAASLREFGDELQRTTTFSNEQAIAAANVFGTLSRNYGLTAEQVQNLITVSADLAAVNGITLTDAAQRVQAAIRGEAESAEALGLTMNETAIGLAGVSAGMSEAEKATFRYNALLEQASFATGAAGEEANTTTGYIQQLANSVQDVGQDFVRFTGPIGQAAGGLMSFSAEAGFAVSGIAALAPVVKSAATAIAGLSAAMGPVGLALAAGVAAYAIYELVTASKDYQVEARATQESVRGVVEALNDLALSEMSSMQLAADAEYLRNTMDTLGGSFEQADADAFGLTTALTTLQSQITGMSGGFMTEADAVAYLNDEMLDLTDQQRSMVTSTAAWNEAIADGQVTATEMAAIIAELETNYDTLGETAGTMGASLDLATDILSRAQETGVNTAEVIGLVAEAFREFETTRDANLLLQRLTAIDQGINTVDATAQRTSQRMLDLEKVMVDAWTSAMDPMQGVEDQLTNIFSSVAPGAYAAQQAINGTTGAVDALGVALVAAAMDPAAQTAAVEQFYATASAVEILNYELALAGDNLAAQDAAFAAFATRVGEAETAFTSFAAGVATANAAIAQQNEIMAANAGTSSRMAFDRQVDEAKTQRAIANTNRIMASQESQMLANGAAAAAYGPVVAANMEVAEAVANTDDAIARQQAQFETSGEAAAEYSRQVGAAEQASAELSAKAYDAATSVGALDTSLEQLTAIGAGQTWEYGKNVLEVANDATIAVNALASGFQTLVQNPINWGREAQGVADWAAGLVLGADGINSLSDLWGRGQIETITFNRGLEAQNRIQTANADIQNDVARIQAKQLPVMADLIESQAKYIDGLADLDPMNQLIALGYMDTTKAAQAQNLVMLAGAAAAGEYGALGTEMATNIITAAAQADPVLKAMLIDMGLISEGADGTVTINFDQAKSLNDDLQRLIDSIDALVIALGGIPAHTRATVDIVTRVNGVQTGLGGIGVGAFATGGTVTHNVATRTPMYATAATGRTTLVGEAGPELVSLPTGAQVTSAPASADRLSRRTAGGGGGVYFYGPVTLQPSSTDVEQAIRREALAGSRGY